MNVLMVIKDLVGNMFLRSTRCEDAILGKAPNQDVTVGGIGREMVFRDDVLDMVRNIEGNSIKVSVPILVKVSNHYVVLSYVSGSMDHVSNGFRVGQLGFLKEFYSVSGVTGSSTLTSIPLGYSSKF